MRGKNVLWLTIALLLISVGFVNVGFTGEEEWVTIAAEPETIRGLPGDYFDLAITITNVTDLRAFGFVLDFAPYTSVLSIIAVTEGDFLSEGVYGTTWFLYSVDTFEGELTVGCVRHKGLGGVSGSGTLVIASFQVVEAGNSPLNLEEVKLRNTAGDYIPHTVVSSEYLGPTATLKHPKGRITQPTWKVGDIAEFNMKAKNTGDVPLYVKVRFTFQRADGMAAYIWTGQSYTGFGPRTVDVAYVDGYIDIGVNDWNLADPPEAMIGEPDGAYIESSGHCAEQGLYTFGDIDTAGRIVENVEFYAYSRCGDTGSDIDSMICWMGGDQFAWGNSQGGTLDWAWTNKRYYWPAYNFPEYYGFPLAQPDVQEAINTAQLAIHNYAGGWQQVDAYKMEVTYSKYTPAQGGEPSYIVLPGQTIDIPDPALWFLNPMDVGYYEASATLFYSYGNEWFIRGHNPPAYHFDFTVEP